MKFRDIALSLRTMFVLLSFVAILPSLMTCFAFLLRDLIFILGHSIENVQRFYVFRILLTLSMGAADNLCQDIPYNLSRDILMY